MAHDRDLAPATTTVDLRIDGMTCASCATRVERALDRIDGVTASVNVATERARVTTPSGVPIDDLLAAVAGAGYSATPLHPAGAPVDHRTGGHASAGDRTGGHAPADHVHGADHDRIHDHGRAPTRGAVDDLRRRLVVSAVFAVPVVLLSMIPVLQFIGWQWVALVLAAPVVTWGAWPFHRAALATARHGGVGMDTLVSLGITAATLWSLYALVVGDAGHAGMQMSVSLIGRPGAGSGEIYLEVATAVTVLILLGRVLEARAKRDAGAAVRNLLALRPTEAVLVAGGVERSVPIAALVPGDVVRVRPGGAVPADGTVIDGAAVIDASMLTGESIPIEAAAGSPVVGGTLVAGGTLLVRVDRVGADTELAKITRLVDDAQVTKARVQRLADRVSAVFVPIVMALSVLAFLGWVLSGADLDTAFTAAVATLIIACPCALGLATPVALLAGTGRGAQLGILIQGPDALERTKRIDTVVLDKTGTVTTGVMSVREVVTDVDPDPGVAGRSGVDPAWVLALAAAVEAGSEHPIARAIREAAAEHGAPGEPGADRSAGTPPAVVVPAATGFVAAPGAGALAAVAGREVVVGSLHWVRQRRVAVPPALVAAVDRIAAAGTTAVVVADAGTAVGVLAVGDTVKPTAAAAVAAIRAIGLRPVLLTGDNPGAAAAVAEIVGIDEVIADASPTEKLDRIRALQADGRVVAMVGDGVNDAAALAAADLGIAMGGGTDVAIAAADLTIVSGDPLAIPDAIRLARRTLGVIRGNLFWAFAYNAAAIPLAMAGLLNPMLAGAAMAFSSLFVVLNSVRLRGFRSVRATA